MGYNNRRRSSGGGSRWMELRYPGTCKVCGNTVPKGQSAYWDAVAKTVTCTNIDCCDQDGLVKFESLTGPWDKRTDLRVRAEHRIGEPAPCQNVSMAGKRIVVTEFNSGAVVFRNARGRCEDAPCCGCCT